MEFVPHSEKQERFIFSEKRITLAATGIQWGKGLPLDAKVLTDAGYRDAGDIWPGDILYDRDGSPTTVLNVFPQGVQPRYRINFTDRKSIVTDGSHLNVLQRRSGRQETVMTTAELFKNAHIWGKAQVPSCKPIDLPHRELMIPPYVLGALLGDGTFNGGVRITSADPELIERISRELPDDISVISYNDISFGLSSRLRDKNGYGSSSFVTELRRLNLDDKKSNSKFVPDEYKFASIAQRHAILQGLMDTDGTCEPTKKMQFFSTSKQLADDVIWLVESLGGKAWATLKPSHYRKEGKRVDCQLCYRVNIISPLFNPFFLSRKASGYFVHENTTKKVIASVDKIDDGETVCFKVDSPSATFIANDQIVTHNSEGGAVRMARKIHQHTRKSDTFIVAAPTFGIMQQATLPTFLEFCDEFGEYHKGDKVFETYWGSIVYFRTGTIGNSVVGIRNCRHIWLDEGGMCSLYFWENLQGRAAPKQATIDITTSPYSMNWVYKELIKPTLDGRRDDVELVQAISKENPYFAQEEYDLRKKTMDPRRFNMMFGGEWGRREGIVYNCFDDVENQIEMSALPEGLRYFAGIDWGYTQEFSLVVIACTDDEVFVVANVKRSQLLISAIKDLVSQFQRLLNIELFICGPDQPGYIRELNTVSNVKATTAINDVMPGIGVVYEMLAGRKLRFVAGKCQYLLDEVEQYHYPAPRDLGVDKDEKEQNPVKANDHSLDALRYVVVTTRNLLKVRGPFTPDVLASAKQDQRQRIKGLLNSHKKSRTEQWA